MEHSLLFKDQVKTKSGLFEIVLAAAPVDLRQFQGEHRAGPVRFYDGSPVVGAEGYQELRRTRKNKYLLKTVQVKFNGHRIPLAPKEWKAVVVSTLKPSADARQYESGVQLIPTVDNDAVEVVLSGGDGVAAFILTWRFSRAGGFRGRVLQGPP